MLLGITFAVYWYWGNLISEEGLSSESVATDVVVEESTDVEENSVTLEDAFAGTGVYTCTLIVGNFTEEYALNYTDFALVSIYNGEYSGTIVYLSDQKYTLSDGVWSNVSIEEEDVGPGRIVPSADSYVCVQDSLNSSLFEVVL